MTSLFTARRKPKRVAREDDDDVDNDDQQDSGPVVRRPTTNAPRTKSRLRVSFNPGGEEDASTVGGGDADEGATGPSKPSRRGLSSAAQMLGSRTGSREQGDDEGQAHDRPKYNRAYLDELKNSTPSTPRDLSSRDSPSLDLVDPSASGGLGLELDLESKFGKAAISAGSSRIPSAAEIREKKERRARLAKEQAAEAMGSGPSAGEDFIALEDYDSDGEFKPRRMQVGSYVPPAREREDTRLVRDDEDIAEGFDEFVEDAGRVTLSRQARREQSSRERAALRTLIDAAEGSVDGSSGGGGDDDGASDSDSDFERQRQYETAQTHRGMDGLRAHAAHTRQMKRPRAPRETVPIPKLGAGLARLRDALAGLEFERARIEKQRADIARERRDISLSQEHIQASLEDAGRELERVTREHQAKLDAAAAAAATATTTATTAPAPAPAQAQAPRQQTNGHDRHPQGPVVERGLESFGAPAPGATG